MCEVAIWPEYLGIFVSASRASNIDCLDSNVTYISVSHMCGVAMGPDGCRDTFGEKICTCSTDKCNNEGINDSQNENGSGRPGQGTSAIILSGLLSVLINKF